MGTLLFSEWYQHWRRTPVPVGLGSNEMPTRFERQRFQSWREPEDIRSYRDIELIKCKIYDGAFGWRYSPDYSRRTTAEGISIINCEVRKVNIGPALFRNILLTWFDHYNGSWKLIQHIFHQLRSLHPNLDSYNRLASWLHGKDSSNPSFSSVSLNGRPVRSCLPERR